VADLLKILGRGLSVSRKELPAARPVIGNEGWYSLVREPFAGAWQRNLEVTVESSARSPVLFRVLTLIASDFAKLRPRLVIRGEGDVWTETESPAFSPVLRKPNRFQTRQQFFECWQLSKQMHGNTYVLKQRDQRGIVVALYILDPKRVTPSVTPDGSVYYEMSTDNLSGLRELTVVPSRELIHDRFNPLYHPLCGLSPIHAAGFSAAAGNEIQRNSATFFSNGSRPSGVLTSPGAISDEMALRYRDYWQQNFTGEKVGNIAVLADGLDYKPLGQMSAVDSQLVEQLKVSDEKICTAFGVPAYMVGVGPAPLNSNAELLAGQFYSQCLQALIEAAEGCLDDGLGLPNDLGVEFDLSGLIRMDAETQAKADAELVKAGILSPNEARARHGLKPVKGGESPMAQQQQFSLAALAERDSDSPFSKPEPAPPADPAAPPGEPIEDKALTDKLRPVLASFAAEIADSADQRNAKLLKRVEALENKRGTS
jgi:HK97 family phage portal protein